MESIGFSIENFEGNEDEDELSGNIQELKEFCFMKKHETAPFSYGTYGRLWNISNQYVAKVCETSHCISVVPEIVILSSLSHDCILKAKYVFKQANEIMFILPKYDCSLEEFEVYDNSIKMSITKQLVSGLQYFHSCGFLHLDLTCKNILIKIYDNNIKACICDFSLSRYSSTSVIQSSVPKVAIDCKPFENLLGSQFFSEKTDCWSLGVCLFKLWEGTHLINFIYVSKNKSNSLAYETSALFEIQKLDAEEKWPPCENSFIRGLLKLDRNERYDMDKMCDILEIGKIQRKPQQGRFSNELLKSRFNNSMQFLPLSLNKIYELSLLTLNIPRSKKETLYICCAAILNALSYDISEVVEELDEYFLEYTFEILAANRGKII